MNEEIVTKSILETVRVALGLLADDTTFDHELVMHVNGAIATLVQNGVVLEAVVIDDTMIWDNLKDTSKPDSQYMFEQVKLFVFVKTKILFDPPPPSTAKYMDEYASEILWRLRESYDTTSEEVPTDGLV